MKSTKVMVAALMAMAAISLSCSSGEVKETGNMTIDSLNQMMARVPVDGYELGKTTTSRDWNGMILAAVPVVKEVMPQVPAGYNLQVTGHTCGIAGVTSGLNYTLSSQRAYGVWAELRKRGITDRKLTYKGVAGTMESGRCDMNDECQRRVTFIVVKK